MKQESNGADFSECGKYRFSLWRIWDESKPLIMFIGLNPSTANQTSDDPTIRRVKRFAMDWGYGGVYMMNLFPFVTAYPSELPPADNEFTAVNIKNIAEISDRCDKVIFAWGNFKEATATGNYVSKMFPDKGYVLQINKNGSPKHPLYVAANIVPCKYLR